MKMRVLAFVFLLPAALALSTASGFAADLFSGTWKTDPARSTYSPGPAPTAAVMQKIEAVENGLTFVGATGFTVKFDGKDVPYKSMQSGAPAAPDTVSAKKISDYEFEITFKSGVKVVSVRKNVISKDGRTRTLTVSGVDVQGRPVSNKIIWEKQ